MPVFKIVINDGAGAATRGIKKSHIFTRTVKAKDLAYALVEIWEDLFEESFEDTVRAEYGKDLEDLNEEEMSDIEDFYEDPLFFVEDLDCSSGDPFVEEIYEDGKLIFSYFD